LVSPQPVNDAPISLLSIHFTGREKEVDFLLDVLSKTQNDRPSCCAVDGMPGVGKSQLVLRYATMSFDRGLYSYIFWISAHGIDKLNQGLAKVLDLVGHSAFRSPPPGTEQKANGGTAVVGRAKR
jgi:hypothetical protein